MTELPDFVNAESYRKSRRLLEEAEIAKKRGILIHFLCILFNLNDRHGAIEAFQHCHELSLKSLWLMLGLTYPIDHDPTKDLSQVKCRLFKIFPYLEHNPDFKLWENWVKKNGPKFKRLHKITIYGDEVNNKYASELFIDEDVYENFSDTEIVYRFALHPILKIGSSLNLLTKEDKTILESKEQLIQELKKIEGIDEVMKNLIRERFKHSRARRTPHT